MERKLPMTLNDQLYSRLVNLYQGLDDEKIHQLNARLILLLSEEISDPLVIKKIIDQIETENKSSSNQLSPEWLLKGQNSAQSRYQWNDLLK